MKWSAFANGSGFVASLCPLLPSGGLWADRLEVSQRAFRRVKGVWQLPRWGQNLCTLWRTPWIPPRQWVYRGSSTLRLAQNLDSWAGVKRRALPTHPLPIGPLSVTPFWRWVIPQKSLNYPGADLVCLAWWMLGSHSPLSTWDWNILSLSEKRLFCGVSGFHFLV